MSQAYSLIQLVKLHNRDRWHSLESHIARQLSDYYAAVGLRLGLEAVSSSSSSFSTTRNDEIVARIGW
ncbi:hypothetical protein Tco_0896118 [Tanacetum coccineum]